MTRSFILKLILACILCSTIISCTTDEETVREGVTDDVMNDIARLNQSRTKEITAAIATLLDDNGAVVGKALFTTEPEGIKVKVTVAAINAEAGEHRLEFHQVGSCYPNFDAAGEPIRRSGHSETTTESSILPPLVLNQNGTASYEAITEQVSFSSGDMALFDDDRSAIILHQGTTNNAAAPAKRLVCGVIEVQLSSFGVAN